MNIVHIPISKNVVGENGECELSNGDSRVALGFLNEVEITTDLYYIKYEHSQ